MKTRKWFDQSQPQTLQGAVVLCYLNAALGVLSLLLGTSAVVLIVLIEAVAANGIANSERWGYWLAVGGAGLYAVVLLVGMVTFLSLGSLFNLVFAGILLVLLLHPMSRSYQRIWFH